MTGPRSLIADAYRPRSGHPCTPPRDRNRVVHASAGSLWRCPTCRRLWTVRRLGMTHGGSLLVPPYDVVWRPAGLLLRWRHRGHPEAPNLGGPRGLGGVISDHAGRRG